MNKTAVTPLDETIQIGKRLMLIACIFITFMASCLAYIWYRGHPLIEDEARELHRQIGENIVSSLVSQLSVYEGVAWSMSAFAEAVPEDEMLFQTVIPQLLNVPSMQGVVAGGGVWPEPSAFDESRDRNSFFWGRDSQGKLINFQNYNDIGNEGYHQEEWYVPVKHNPKQSLYWSRSYTDPYSKQIMVTASAPIYKQGKFWGVSTVDLMLEGVNALIEKITQDSGGYAFVVDRNGKFITFPKVGMIDVNTLAEREPTFMTIARFIKTVENNAIASINQHGDKYAELAKEIETHSYQIGLVESRIIAAHLVEPAPLYDSQVQQLQSFTNEDDMLLNQPVQVSIFEMPSTHWHVVTVFPTNATQLFAKQISRDLTFFILTLVALFCLVNFLLCKLVCQQLMRYK